MPFIVIYRRSYQVDVYYHAVDHADLNDDSWSYTFVKRLDTDIGKCYFTKQEVDAIIEHHGWANYTDVRIEFITFDVDVYTPERRQICPT